MVQCLLFFLHCFSDFRCCLVVICFWFSQWCFFICVVVGCLSVVLVVRAMVSHCGLSHVLKVFHFFKLGLNRF